MASHLPTSWRRLQWCPGILLFRRLHTIRIIMTLHMLSHATATTAQPRAHGERHGRHLVRLPFCLQQARSYTRQTTQTWISLLAQARDRLLQAQVETAAAIRTPLRLSMATNLPTWPVPQLEHPLPVICAIVAPSHTRPISLDDRRHSISQNLSPFRNHPILIHDGPPFHQRRPHFSTHPW